MNLVLLPGSYPPVAARREVRLGYLQALQEQVDDGAGFDRLMLSRLAATLAEYVAALRDNTAAG